MPIDAVSAAAGSTQQRKTDIAGDFDTFLRLLTTQLANQDPLSPMDSNQFTEQLVQFASVEQSVAMNEKLDKVLALIDADKMGAGTGYLGREVEVDVSTVQLGATGTANFAMSLEDKPAAVAVTVKDHRGKTVATLAPPPQAGRQTVVRDGRTSDGLRAPAGTYDVEVEAMDAAGVPVAVSTRLSGVVRAVEHDGGTLFLDVAGQRVALGDVTTVRTPTEPHNEGASS
jgi:flagellar basal-body rod modification protein FlgD